MTQNHSGFDLHKFSGFEIHATVVDNLFYLLYNTSRHAKKGFQEATILG